MKRRDVLKTGAVAIVAAVTPTGTALAKATPKTVEVTPKKQVTEVSWDLDRTEAKILAERWEKSGMLNKRTGDERLWLACLLESQRLHNEVIGDFAPGICFFKRNSIPLCRRVFDRLTDMGIQVVSPIIKDETVPVDAMVMNPVPDAPFWSMENLGQTYAGHRAQHNLDKERDQNARAAETAAEQIAKFCEKTRRKQVALLGFGMVQGVAPVKCVADYVWTGISDGDLEFMPCYSSRVVVAPRVLIYLLT